VLAGAAEALVVLPSLSVVERVLGAGRELALGIEGGGAGVDVGAVGCHGDLVAEGVIGVVGLQPQRRRVGLDYLLGEQAGVGVVGEG
jgi:hypothetical protein